MSRPPANDDEGPDDLVLVTLPYSFGELLQAFRDRGALVEVGIVDGDRGFIRRDND